MLKSVRIILWIVVLIAICILVYSRLADKYNSRYVPIGDPSVEINNIKESITGIYMESAKPIPTNQLHSADKTWTAKDWKDHWSILYFGFSNCPDVCPAALGLLSFAFPKIEALIPPTEYDRLRGVMITVDPFRDNAEQLKTYTEFYHPRFMGLTGEVAEINKFTTEFGVFYDFPEGTNTTTNYPVGHSSTYIVINPDGNFQAVLTEHSDAMIIAQDIAQIINHWHQQQD